MNPSNLGLLVLVRLLPPDDRGESRDKVGKDLAPLGQCDSSATEWSARLDAELVDLESGGLIQRIKKGKAVRLVATPEGKRLALQRLGLEQLPAKTTWAKLKSTHVLALALGRESPSAAEVKRITAGPGLKAELLKSHYDLPLDDHATLKQATDALSLKLLGIEPGEPFTMDRIVLELLRREGIELKAGQKPSLKAVQECLLRRELEEPNAKDPLTRIIARNVHARQIKPAALGEAAVRRWVEKTGQKPPTASTAPLDAFAARVREAARVSPSGWFGDGKVFIGHVWRALRFEPAFRGLDFDSFKARLVEAHNARLIELGRGDLVESMDPVDVRESATPYLNAVYHFVRVEKEDR